jgi:predicted ATPase
VNDAAERFFVITGGPGSGKSTLTDALERAGYTRSVEAGRAIIQAQVAIDGPALPWRDPALFAELMLSWELRSYGLAQEQRGPMFFDRGVPDVVGYLRLTNLPVPVHMGRAAETYRYHRRVFIAPPWREIFAQDGERKQDFAEAVRTYDAMVATYADFGYELVELPRISIESRVDFVLEQAGLRSRVERSHA